MPMIPCRTAAVVLALCTGAAAQAQGSGKNFAEPDRDGRIRTQFAARETAVVSSELNAKIARLPLKEGDAFRAGQTLVAFDCSLFESQLRKAEASHEAARKLLAVNQRLAELNSAGRLEVEQAEAKVKESAAEAAYVRATVAKCSIGAPFAGRVAKRLATASEFATPGKPLLEIVDSGPPELQLIVPSRWLARLKVGSTFTVSVDELGQSFPAKVVRLGARIDPVSQSVAITGQIVGQHPGLLPGMSGWASFTGLQ
jgi:RND family efflux transporter MFP subunit